jgi:carboxylesterase
VLAQEAAMIRLAIVILLAVGLGLLWLFLAPIPGVRQAGPPHPAKSFQEAVARIRKDSERDGPDVAPDCRGILFEHGHRTGRAVLFFHGITNCPAQFMALGTELYRRGITVYVPRLPHHGLSNRMTDDLARLDAQEMATFAEQQLDIARGLGDTLIVSGLSLGGVLAAWLGQERTDVDRAAPIAPLLGPSVAPASMARPITRLALALPNRFLWWDDKRKEDLPGPRRVYPRFSTRAMAEIMRLGVAVEERAKRRAPAARELILITVGADPAVSNAAIARLAESWRRRASDRVETYEFPESLKLGHDLIDPEQPYQRVADVYPMLIDKLLGSR